MNKKTEKGFSVLEVLLILGLVVVIAGAGWYVYKHKHTAKSNNSITSSSSATSPKSNIASPTTGSTISTADWQTHGEAMFSIKFPKAWSYLAKGDIFTATDGSQQESIENQFVPNGEQPNQGKELEMEQADNTKLLTAEQYAQQNPLAQGQVVSKDSFKANGNDAYMEIDGGIANSAKTNRVIIVSNKFPVAVIFHYDTVSSYTKTFEQMFQTIQFQSSCTSTVGC
jgi:uncharacterized protein (UPF0333 family)